MFSRQGLEMALDERDRRILKRIAANLRAERARQGVSQEDIAWRAGFSGQKTVSRLEVGDTESGITRYVRAAWAIDMPLELLFDGVAELSPHLDLK